MPPLPPDAHLREVMRLHERPLLRYAWQLSGDAELARDATQDAFLAHFRECSAGRAPEHDAAWLFRVCRNRVFRLLEHRRRHTPMDPQLLPESPVSESPADTLRDRERQDSLAARIRTLPARDREVLRLKFQNGMTYRQIAEITGLSASNVGFILHTAVKTLRAELAPSAHA